MFFKQLFDTESSTYTYVLADEPSCEAIIIDAVREHLEDYLEIFKTQKLTLKYALETHVHADHITAAGSLRQRIGCKIAECHRSKALGVDLLLKESDTLAFGSHTIHVMETPGHTPCSICYLIENKLFTGDTLFINGCGRTDFQDGSAEKLWHSVTEKLFTLPPDTKVYPGHDYNQKTVSTIAEEIKNNPRFQGKSKEDFITLMNNLKLSPPQKIREAVPANLKLE